LVVVDFQEEEAAKGKARGAPGEKLKKGAWITGKEDSTDEREEEGTQAEGSQRESCGRSTGLGPVESRRLDRSSECHTTTQASHVGEETHQHHRSGATMICLVERKVTKEHEDSSGKNSRPRASMINEGTYGHTQGIHAQVTT
jgi:hypothetical protein